MAEAACEDEQSVPMRLALDLVEALGTASLTVIPMEPTPEMIEAGAAAGRLDRETVRRIYTAMLRALE